MAATENYADLVFEGVPERLDAAGEVLLHRNVKSTREALLEAKQGGEAVPAALGAWFSTGMVLALGILLLISNRQTSRVPFMRARSVAQSVSDSRRVKSVFRARVRPRLCDQT